MQHLTALIIIIISVLYREGRGTVGKGRNCEGLCYLNKPRIGIDCTFPSRHSNGPFRPWANNDDADSLIMNDFRWILMTAAFHTI